MTSRPPYPDEDPPRRQLPGPGPYPPEYHLPPPYGSYPGPGYGRPPKKKAKWPWILAGIMVVLLVLLGACIAFTGGGHEVDQQAAAQVTLILEVSSDGPLDAHTSYSRGDGSTIEQANQQRLSSTTPVTVTGLAHPFSLTAQADRTATTITCTVREGEKILTTHTSTGPSVIVSCR
ncbi:hypothetical protein AB0H60_31260 [Nocardia rhamnosiphila]|uniref:hypothetical protein n=1 Tax=Nocardia rhamnosiphila TaxID=426716 RepID=UPI0033E162B8